MSIRKTPFVLDEFYHIYNRGNSKQNIFLDKKDYNRFVDLLFVSNRKEKFNFSDLVKTKSVYELSAKPLVAIGAYCLMPNHFHILVTPLVDKGISLFMQKLTTAYSMYFNERHERTGGLFEGKFKSQHVDNDRYLKYIFSYIHLNPLKILRKNFELGNLDILKDIEILNTYPYSSFLDFLENSRMQSKILNKDKFPLYFNSSDEFLGDIKEWIFYRDSLGLASRIRKVAP